MGKLATFTRRSFLIGSAAIAGGLAFGIYKVKETPDNPLADDLSDGSAAFNPWVLVDRDKVTLIVPHADKGQGVASAQAALLAEELDLEWGGFETSFGEPSVAYWNTAMAEEGVPFMSTDESTMAETMRGVMGGVMKLMGMQGTGGSTSMPDSFVKLREAGAVARETLKLAAAKESGHSVDSLKTENGAVILPDGTRVPYTALAATAATIEPVSKVPLRDPSQWRLIGKPMPRLDVPGKSTGTLNYGIDIAVDGMVHATVKLNPRQGGELKSYNADKALNMPGVQQVIEISGGIAVIASNTWYAIQGANAVEVEWGDAPYPAEQKDHWQAIEDSFTQVRLDKVWRNDGDIDLALADSAIVSAEYRSPYVAHQPLEPLNAIAKVTDDQVELWTGHQIPRMLQQQIAKITGHEADQVVFHNQYMGGSFGHRLEMEHVKQAAEIASQLRGTPVKMTYSREEDFAHDFPRHIAMARGQGAIRDGKVDSIDLSIASVSPINSQMSRANITVPGPDPQIVAGSWNNPYKVPNFRMRGYRVPELAPVSSWRAVGANGAGFFFDSFLDELIHAAGADPMQERIRLMDHDASRKVLETVAEMSSWGSEAATGSGKGVAFVESFGVPTAAVVEVTQTDGGIRIKHVWLTCDVGTVVDPLNFENLVQGGVVWGLGHAINCEITYADGMAQQTNYHAHEAMRMHQCPVIEVKGLENGHKIRGVGEPPVPVTAPALANAIFAATGQRIRELPLNRHIDFV
jgi:isoquinoline 1-oxidoreductase beta subunit